MLSRPNLIDHMEFDIKQLKERIKAARHSKTIRFGKSAAAQNIAWKKINQIRRDIARHSLERTVSYERRNKKQVMHQNN